MEDDSEYLNDCLKASFYIFQNSIILSDITNTPSKSELAENSIEEVEALHGHYHMSFITYDYERQKKYAFQIWHRWRLTIRKTLPKEKVILAIIDNGDEIIISTKLAKKSHLNDLDR